ncbi:MAG: CarD family transcriptional regulator [Actinomycetia bacterium]|nr:CarD family transcriptional regulator [Actinomycetes bacterium]MCH9801296.1 CarD family transcriptional regulator [Actinomycetes bacterium]
MTFKVGDTVVYPHHGAAEINAIEHKNVNGKDLEILVLQVHQGNLIVRVPAQNVDLVGVRDVVNSEGLDEVFEVLRKPYVEEPTNWSRRYKANLEKLASGDVVRVAEVIRDLWRRDQDRGLSAGEKRMLTKARAVLVSELALAEDTNEDKAEALLDEVLAS